MKHGAIALVIMISFGILTACSTPEERAAEAQERAYEAQEDLVKERLKLVDQCRDCVKASASDSYLKSAGAIK